jgi:transcriptional regulator with PAS, ATPase and Fis domain
MVREGKFRGDLFFRLNVMNICLPSLRERKEDIGALVHYLIDTINEEYGRNVLGADPETLECLARYDWPGNVRELRNSIERLMMLEQEKILSAEHLPPGIRRIPQEQQEESPGVIRSDFTGEHIVLPATGISLEELEKLLIQLALKRSDGNQTKAAKFLKTSRDTLRYRMKKFGLSDGTREEPGTLDGDDRLGAEAPRSASPETLWT